MTPTTAPARFLHLRKGMDVYSSDQNHYLGSVVRVWRGTPPPPPDVSGDAAHTMGDRSAPMVHEEGGSVPHAEHHSKEMLGESMGPVPTGARGNTGPVRQSAEHSYATALTQPADVVRFAVRPGRINLGILTPSFYVPTTAVQSMSMERIVVSLPDGEIPDEWKRKPR